jgi:hypothetical protein
MALPPRFITSTPTWEARRLVEATIPCIARTGCRAPAASTSTVELTDGTTGAKTNARAKRSIMRERFVEMDIFFLI